MEGVKERGEMIYDTVYMEVDTSGTHRAVVSK